MNKKVGIVLAVVGAVLLLCCLGSIFFLKSFTNRVLDTVTNDKAFVAKALTATAKNWDENEFATFADPSFNTPEHRDATRKLFGTLKQKLGPLVSLQEVTEDKKSFKADTNSDKPGFFVSFHAKAKFVKGNGAFRVTVKNAEKKMTISDIGLDPDNSSK